MVLMDKNAPISYITRPADDGDGVSGRYKPLDIGQFNGTPQNHLSGSASDLPLAPLLNSGVEKVQVRLSYLLNGDTYYCMGAKFSSGTVTDVGAWNDASRRAAVPLPGITCRT